MHRKMKEKQGESTCCGHEQFKGMFDMMSKCFTGDTGLSNSTEIMKKMKETCCGPGKDESKSES